MQLRSIWSLLTHTPGAGFTQTRPGAPKLLAKIAQSAGLCDLPRRHTPWHRDCRTQSPEPAGAHRASAAWAPKADAYGAEVLRVVALG